MALLGLARQPDSAPTAVKETLPDDISERVQAKREAAQKTADNGKDGWWQERMASRKFVSELSPALRVQLSSRICTSGAGPQIEDENLAAVSGSLLSALIRDGRKDVAVELLSRKNVLAAEGCSLIAELHEMFVTGISTDGAELLCEAYDSAEIQRRTEIENEIAYTLCYYFENNGWRAEPRGPATVAWMRKWYLSCRDQLITNVDVCVSGGDATCEAPALIELRLALDHLLNENIAELAAGKLTLAGPGMSPPPACVAEEKKRPQHPPQLQRELTVQKASFIRVANVRDFERCDDWIRVHASIELADRGRRTSTWRGTVRLLLHSSGKLLILLPDAEVADVPEAK
ncbi:MAG: hypothetical protein JNK16_11610 [Phycisphaerales bacterium]|nr:hypothetical protein [Phycisphaerales bacterium]